MARKVAAVGHLSGWASIGFGREQDTLPCVVRSRAAAVRSTHDTMAVAVAKLAHLSLTASSSSEVRPADLTKTLFPSINTTPQLHALSFTAMACPFRTLAVPDVTFSEMTCRAPPLPPPPPPPHPLFPPRLSASPQTGPWDKGRIQTASQFQQRPPWLQVMPVTGGMA